MPNTLHKFSHETIWECDHKEYISAHFRGNQYPSTQLSFLYLGRNGLMDRYAKVNSTFPAYVETDAVEKQNSGEFPTTLASTGNQSSSFETWEKIQEEIQMRRISEASLILVDQIKR